MQLLKVLHWCRLGQVCYSFGANSGANKRAIADLFAPEFAKSTACHFEILLGGFCVSVHDCGAAVVWWGAITCFVFLGFFSLFMSRKK